MWIRNRACESDRAPETRQVCNYERLRRSFLVRPHPRRTDRVAARTRYSTQRVIEHGRQPFVAEQRHVALGDVPCPPGEQPRLLAVEVAEVLAVAFGIGAGGRIRWREGTGPDGHTPPLDGT